MNYIIQGKNGNSEAWKDLSRCSDEQRAKQRALQIMKNKRGKPGFQWYKTRVKKSAQ